MVVARVKRTRSSGPLETIGAFSRDRHCFRQQEIMGCEKSANTSCTKCLRLIYKTHPTYIARTAGGTKHVAKASVTGLGGNRAGGGGGGGVTGSSDTSVAS